MKAKSFLRALLFFLTLLTFFMSVLIASLPDEVGAIDFRPYWSASYLFARGLDFGDLQALDHIERNLTGWKGPFTMQAWFTPIGHLLLAPLTLLPFHQAVKAWLLLNIASLGLSAGLLWEGARQKVGLALFAVFSFSMTLTSLYFGQVNPLVLLGLALFLHFRRVQNDLLAGSSLVLSLVKPHLVIFTFPVLILNLIWKKQWRVLKGFLFSLLFLGALLFILNPGWVFSFSKVAQSGLGSSRLTPSLAGLLIYWGFEWLGKWLWLGGLLVALLGWWKFKGIEERTLCDLTLLLGLALTPFGWSYDQILVLFPILRIIGWIVKQGLPEKQKWFLGSSLLFFNALTYYQRLVVQNDLWFFWLPLGVLGVYCFAERFCDHRA